MTEPFPIGTKISVTTERGKEVGMLIGYDLPVDVAEVSLPSDPAAPARSHRVRIQDLVKAE